MSALSFDVVVDRAAPVLDVLVDAPPILAETRRLVEAMTAPPTADRKYAIDRAIRRMINAGVWAKGERIHVRAAHSAQAAPLDWKDPAVSCTAVNSPVFTADAGFQGANTRYIDWNWNPGDGGTHKFKQNDNTFAAWVLTDVQAEGYVLGTNNHGLIPRNGVVVADAIFARNSNNTPVSFVPDTVGPGLYSCRRIASGGYSIDQGGNQVAAVTQASTDGVLNMTWHELKRNGSGVAWGASAPSPMPAPT